MGERRLNRRERILIRLALLGMAVLLARAVQVQLVFHGPLSERAEIQQCDTIIVAAPRGAIMDRNATVLVETIENASLWAHPGEVRDPSGLDRELSAVGWVRSGDVVRRLEQARDRHFIWLYRGWTDPALAGGLERDWPGLHTSTEWKRIYPAGSLCDALLGSVGSDGEGLSGLELALDPWLQGRPGRQIRFVTGGRYPGPSHPPRMIDEPRPGHDVRLSLDLRAQEIVVRRLREGVQQWNARGSFAIVMDPMTGEILAVASVPHPDTSRRREGEISPFRLRPFCDQWEPGSTFKGVIFAIALEAGLLDLDEPIDCEEGRWRTEHWNVRDHEPHGILAASDALVHSSNIAAAKIALRVGAERLYRSMRHLGFGVPTGVPFPGEAEGRILPPEDWNGRSLPTIGFGQEISVTALQLALFYGAIANGGYLLRPILVSEILDPVGRVVERRKPQVVRRVLREETCRTLAGLLRQVVERGTGTRAEIPWFPPAGKTGTAQVYDPATGTYSRSDYLASFVGFAPWHEPRYLCLVVLDSPEGSIYGGQTSAPIFRAILEDLTAAGGGLPRAQVAVAAAAVEPRPLPDVRGLAPDEARALLKAGGFVPVLEGRGLRVKEMTPAPGTLAMAGDVVRLLPGAGREGAEATMPDLRGWPLRRALVLLSRRGLAWSVEGDGWIARQDPAPGARLAPPATCRLIASHRSSEAWANWMETWEGVADAAPWGHAGPRP